MHKACWNNPFPGLNIQHYAIFGMSFANMSHADYRTFFSQFFIHASGTMIDYRISAGGGGGVDPINCQVVNLAFCQIWSGEGH